MKVSLRQLEILQAISIAGSISRATRQLCMSQPSISQQLAKMEEALGVQLLVRGRSTRTELTPAGQFWAGSADRILSSVEEVERLHQERFDEKAISLSFGTTPSLTGRFTEMVADIAVSLPGISRFHLVWSVDSDGLIERLMTHRLDIALMSASSLEPYRASLHVYDLYEDKIAWVVPASVSEDQIRACIAEADAPCAVDSLGRYAALDGHAPWAARTRNWYQNTLPQAQPFFTCMTHHHAVHIVAAGLATCHTPISLIPNLPSSVLNRVRFYELEQNARTVALAMPKHLFNVRSFHDFAEQVSALVRAQYSPGALKLEPLPDPGPGSAGPGRGPGRGPGKD